MMPDAQRIVIAEVCGWKRVPERDHLLPDGVLQALPECFVHDEEETVWTEHDLPDYLNDLNAMHEAEKTLTKDKTKPLSTDQRCLFINHLGKIIGCWTVVHEHNTLFQLAHATAAQRAEAFLRTIEKWKD